MGLYHKKSYDFKPHGCDELSNFDIPFALKELLQNVVGQILKALEVREWRDWVRQDLAQETPDIIRKRKVAKAILAKEYPCLFAGQQGKAIGKSDACQPEYVLTTVIPRAHIKATQFHGYNHDFQAAIVLWRSGSEGHTSISVYNNYLDPEAKFSHFVHDGLSTSQKNKWAVGLKGKGFILAMSYLAEECQSLIDQSVHDELKEVGVSKGAIGVGFNVGGRFCRGAYSKGSLRKLKMKREDLRAVTVNDFMNENPDMKAKDDRSDRESESEGEAEYMSWSRSSTTKERNDRWWRLKVQNTYQERVKQRLSTKLDKFPNPTDPSHEIALVKNDDVCVHIVGLRASLNAEEAFSAVYGIFPPTRSWRVPNTLFEIFEPGKRIYHRDQLVRVLSPLEGLSINYHGDLKLTSDRMVFFPSGGKYDTYMRRLCEALETAICNIPELAGLIMASLINTSDQLAHEITPHSKENRKAYKLAFQTACRAVDGNQFLAAENKTAFPYAERAAEHKALIEEVGFIPWELAAWKLNILEAAGAYESIRKHTEILLRKAPIVPLDSNAALDIFQRCAFQLMPDLNRLSVHQYTYTSPQVLCYDQELILAQPEDCEECPKGGCYCWVANTLIYALESYTRDKQSVKVDRRKIFRTYENERRLKDAKDLETATRPASGLGEAESEKRPTPIATPSKKPNEGKGKGKVKGSPAKVSTPSSLRSSARAFARMDTSASSVSTHPTHIDSNMGDNGSPPIEQHSDFNAVVDSDSSFGEGWTTSSLPHRSKGRRVAFVEDFDRDQGMYSSEDDVDGKAKTAPAVQDVVDHAAGDLKEITAGLENLDMECDEIRDRSRSGDWIAINKTMRDLRGDIAKMTETATQARDNLSDLSSELRDAKSKEDSDTGRKRRRVG